MLTCKQVANALAERRYWELPWHRRLGLQVHVALCAVCHRYNRQVMLAQDLAGAYARREEAGELPDGPGALDEQAKARIIDAMRRKGGA